MHNKKPSISNCYGPPSPPLARRAWIGLAALLLLLLLPALPALADVAPVPPAPGCQSCALAGEGQAADRPALPAALPLGLLLLGGGLWLLPRRRGEHRRRHGQRHGPAALFLLALVALLLLVPLLAHGQDPFATPGAPPSAAPPPPVAEPPVAEPPVAEPPVAEPGLPVGLPVALPQEMLPEALQLAARCAHITAALCGKQNLPLAAVAVGYVIVCVLLFSLLRGFWNKRGTGSAGFRFWLPLLLAATLAGLLVGLDPLRGRDLVCCLGDPVHSAQIFLQDSAVGRAFLLGVLPCGLLYVIVTFVVGLAKR